MEFGGTLIKLGDNWYPSGHAGQTLNWQRHDKRSHNGKYGAVAFQTPTGSIFGIHYFETGSAEAYKQAVADAWEWFSRCGKDPADNYLLVCIS